MVATCVDKLNIGTLAQTYELMKVLGIQAWRIAPPQEIGNWRGTTTATPLDQQAEVYAPLLEHWLDDGKPFSIQLSGFYRGDAKRTPEADRPGQLAKQGAGARRGRQRPSASGLKRPPEMPVARVFTVNEYDCGHCREQLNLLPDGTLVPCPGYVDSPLQNQMPNLLHEDLSQVWTTSFLRSIADMKKKDLLAANPECAACELFKECGVGCRAYALTATGNLLAKDPVTCELCKKGYKKRFREMAASEPVAAGATPL